MSHRLLIGKQMFNLWRYSDQLTRQYQFWLRTASHAKHAKTGQYRHKFARHAAGCFATGCTREMLFDQVCDEVCDTDICHSDNWHCFTHDEYELYDAMGNGWDDDLQDCFDGGCSADSHAAICSSSAARFCPARASSSATSARSLRSCCDAEDAFCCASCAANSI